MIAFNSPSGDYLLSSTELAAETILTHRPVLRSTDDSSLLIPMPPSLLMNRQIERLSPCKHVGRAMVGIGSDSDAMECPLSAGRAPRAQLDPGSRCFYVILSDMGAPFWGRSRKRVESTIVAIERYEQGGKRRDDRVSRRDLILDFVQHTPVTITRPSTTSITCIHYHSGSFQVKLTNSLLSKE